MRFMVIVKGNKNYEAGMPPDPKLIAAIEKHSAAMAAAGVLLEAGGLLPSSQGAIVRASRGKVLVTDGPFAETKELVGGFAILRLNSKAEAIEHVKNFISIYVDVLGPSYEGELEIRQMIDSADQTGQEPCEYSELPRQLVETTPAHKGK